MGGRALTLEEKRDRALERLNQNQTNTEEPIDPSKPTRAVRNTFNGTEGKMRINNMIEGYHLHWLNDAAGRIQQALQGGYTFVTSNEVGGLVNSNITDRNTDLGEKVRMLVGHAEDGGPMYAYLMKIPLEFWEEDQAALQARSNQIDAAIRKGKVTGGDPSFYIPRDGIKMS